jgi:hypothetical protein
VPCGTCGFFPANPKNKTREQAAKHHSRVRPRTIILVSTQTPTGYFPDFDIDLERGQIQEQLVRRLISNDPGHLTVEVKGDYRAQSTLNHYVEVQQRGRDGAWRDSGVRTTKADYWNVALADSTVIMVPTPKVRALAEAAMDAGNWREMDRGDNPTRGALVPLSKLVA